MFPRYKAKKHFVHLKSFFSFHLGWTLTESRTKKRQLFHVKLLFLVWVFQTISLNSGLTLLMIEKKILNDVSMQSLKNYFTLEVLKRKSIVINNALFSQHLFTLDDLLWFSDKKNLSILLIGPQMNDGSNCIVQMMQLIKVFLHYNFHFFFDNWWMKTKKNYQIIFGRHKFGCEEADKLRFENTVHGTLKNFLN